MSTDERITVTNTDTLDQLREVLVEVLGLPEGAVIEPATLLFGTMPELDSLALVELIAAIEDSFGFTMDEMDISAEVFESVGSLSAYVDQQRA